MRAFIRIWRVPALLAAITLGGLIGALVGDGIWDQVSWVALATPVALLLRCALSSGERPTSPLGRRI